MAEFAWPFTTFSALCITLSYRVQSDLRVSNDLLSAICWIVMQHLGQVALAAVLRRAAPPLHSSPLLLLLSLLLLALQPRHQQPLSRLLLVQLLARHQVRGAADQLCFTFSCFISHCLSCRTSFNWALVFCVLFCIRFNVNRILDNRACFHF